MIVVKAENLRAYYILDVYGEKQFVKAVDNVNLNVEENEIYGIAGESGCGKSTLIKTLYGMIEPPLNLIDGKVFYKINDDYLNIFTLSDSEIKKIRWEFISYIPQGSMSVLNPVTKIIDTFYDFVSAHKKDVSKKEIEELTKEYLNALGLPSKILRAYPHQLSGGMRQRVTIALATILRPRVIIADEPSTALDVVAQRGVIQLLKDIQSSQKNTIILVTHDMGVHATISDRIGIMYAGHLIEEAKTEEIFENPLHPYTKYLIGSLPKMGDKSYKISAPGLPPNLINPPSGCRFHPRCEYAMPECKENIPELINIKEGHKVSCFLYAKERKI